MQIKEAKYLTSSPSVEKCPIPDRPEIAFIGRSNVGKSSLINMLCNNNKLAKTSAIPGKTQLINHFEILITRSAQKVNRPEQKWYLVDLPGYGFAKVSQSDRKKWEKMIKDYIRKRENLLILFVLLDSRLPPQKIDLEFLNKLGEWKIPFALIFTKADKSKPLIVERNVNNFMKALRQNWESPPNFFVSSTVTRQGKEEMLEFIAQLNLTVS